MFQSGVGTTTCVALRRAESDGKAAADARAPGYGRNVDIVEDDGVAVDVGVVVLPAGGRRGQQEVEKESEDEDGERAMHVCHQ